jgi:4-amino-4-deoxy-L-arabinose transferase-like glycosyltransferase
VSDLATLETPSSPAEAPPPEGSRPKRRWLDIGVPTALVVGTAATRLPYLSTPRAFVFDEIYYVPDAASILRNGVEQGGVVHPPGGKWLIAAGIRAFGFTSFGWRFAALVAGCLIVLLTYVTARQLVRGHLIPALAGAAVALDGVSFTTGRVGMLDVFLALFTTLAITFTVFALRHPENERRVMWCRWGAAVSLGLGLTVKWSAVYLLLAVLLAFLWLNARQPKGRRQARAVLATVVMFSVVPATIYALAYVPWIVNADKAYQHVIDCQSDHDCSLALTNRIRQLIEDQNRILEFQRTSKQDTNSNAAPAWKWVNQHHPTIMFRTQCSSAFNQAPDDLADNACSGAGDGKIMEIVTVANPVVWFTALGAGVVLVVLAIRRRSMIMLFLLLAGVYQWLFWAVNDRYSYSFYIAPIIPVFALWIAIVFAHRWFRYVAPLFAVLLVAAFVFYYPIWAGRPLTPDQARAREYWLAY